MKALVCLALLSLAPAAHAEEYQPQCLKQARAAVATAAQVRPSELHLHSAGLVGDGVNVLETIAFQVRKSDPNAPRQYGLYIVTMAYSFCEVFQEPKLLNN